RFGLGLPCRLFFRSRFLLRGRLLRLLLFRRRRFATQQLDLRHLELGQLGAVAGAAPVALLRLVFEDLDLLAAQVLGDGRLDLDLLEIFGAENDFLVAEHHHPQGDFFALFGAQPVDEERSPLLDPILLSPGLYDCVRVHSSLLPWLERDRPRPPLRPRRRLREAEDSSSEPFSPLPPVPLTSAPGSEATAAARSTRSMRTSLRS